MSKKDEGIGKKEDLSVIENCHGSQIIGNEGFFIGLYKEHKRSLVIK